MAETTNLVVLEIKTSTIRAIAVVFNGASEVRLYDNACVGPSIRYSEMMPGDDLPQRVTSSFVAKFENFSIPLAVETRHERTIRKGCGSDGSPE